MTGHEFKTARKSRLKYSQSELATAMQTPKRTIQDLEALADQDVRGVYAVCIELLITKSEYDMEYIRERLNWDVQNRFPNGF